MTIRCINRHIIDEHNYIIGHVEIDNFTPRDNDIYLPLLDDGILIPDIIWDQIRNKVPLRIVPYRMCTPVEAPE